MKVRIKFTKHGAVKFIGHLDMMRYFQKAMRRGDVDIKYSEGFSPHQVMSFAAPLGVGLTSNGEYMDIEVMTTKDSQTMIAQLNHVMAEGIQVVSYRRLEDTSKTAMSMVAAADYTIAFRNAYRPEDMNGFFQGLEAFQKQEQILIRKKTKKSEKEVDIKPLIYDVHREGERIFMRLATGSANNLKPELVLEAYYQSKGWEYPVYGFQIQREEVYSDLGDVAQQRLVSLEDLGDDIE